MKSCKTDKARLKVGDEVEHKGFYKKGFIRKVTISGYYVAWRGGKASGMADCVYDETELKLTAKQCEIEFDAP